MVAVDVARLDVLVLAHTGRLRNRRRLPRAPLPEVAAQECPVVRGSAGAVKHVVALVPVDVDDVEELVLAPREADRVVLLWQNSNHLVNDVDKDGLRRGIMGRDGHVSAAR
jgi:hypothetical protein